MKNLTFLISLFASIGTLAQNVLYIPPTISSTNISLTLQEGTTQFYNGVTTNTLGANGSLLGPTLIMDNGSSYNITVDNQLSDTTTIHWHGLHVSPENDGGPHTIILSGDTWNPQFTVLDKAGTYWYHPHLHMKTNEHVSKGIAGMILVRDAEEAGLNLPMTYGVDEFPLVLQTKGFDSGGQIEVETNMDTSVMVNGTVNATVDFPAQVVRLRVLNGASQRVMEFGFSDNRSFSLIGTDGGLLQAPVSLTRYRISPGQRADILVDLTSDQGQNIQLMSYASELPNGYYGAAQPGMGPGATSSLTGYTSNPLNGNDFQLLDINVVAQTGSPVTVIPSSLVSFTPLQEGTEDITRYLTFGSAGTMGDLNGPFLINGASMDLNVINYTIPLDNIEIWSLANQTPIAHPFHIHDVQFFILDIGASPPPPELEGYNDVVMVPAMTTVRFIAQFNDHTSDTVPYMYHCHMLPHEDGGMMGQFIVSNSGSGLNEHPENKWCTVYPNPSVNGEFHLNSTVSIVNYTVFNSDGKIVKSERNLQNQNSVDIHLEESGMYIIQVSGDDFVEQFKVIVEN